MNKMLEALEREPWLEPFIEDDDEDLDPARKRWTDAVTAAKAELRRLGVQVYERAKTAGGLETTMLLVRREGENR